MSTKKLFDKISISNGSVGLVEDGAINPLKLTSHSVFEKYSLSKN